MIQKEFAQKAKVILEKEEMVIGLAVGGSWLTDQLDDYSDLDLILISKESIAHDKKIMLEYASKLGNLLSAFTGEHVGEPRLLICLYADPLLHVDIKFLTLQEVKNRIESPYLLMDKNGVIENVLLESEAIFPLPNYQWIEDRFWIWIHYALLKIGRGEFLEALDFMGFLRMSVLGPLIQVKNKNLPRGVRKVEFELTEKDLNKLLGTIPFYAKNSLLDSIKNAVNLYRELRSELYTQDILIQLSTEEKVMKYLKEIEKK